jgi:hypothetical protein
MNAIETSVNHLQWLFTIVMALAITEGLRAYPDNPWQAITPGRS